MNRALPSVPTLGIIGGMSPDATALFYRYVIMEWQRRFQPKEDADYPRILIDSLPAPEFLNTTAQQDELLALILDAVKQMELAGVHCLAMPCCTAHILLKDICKSVSTRWISVVEEAANHVQSNGYRRVLVLATRLTLRSRLFADAFEARAIQPIEPAPEQLNTLMEVISNIIAGRHEAGDADLVSEMIRSASAAGADAVLLGCTDLPVALGNRSFALPTIDASLILAEAAVACLSKLGDVHRAG